MSNSYDALSEERKRQQEQGVLPPHFSTGGFQMFMEKYLYGCNNFKEQAERISKVAKHLKDPDLVAKYEKIFFNMIWKGHLSCSTPVLANTGTNRGMPVSCSGTYVDDSILGFYDAQTENAILTQEGFGTSAYLGDIRPRGSKISRGGKSAGLVPVMNQLRQMSLDVSQGGVRRGSIAVYIPITHGDFWEAVKELKDNTESLNVGWCVSDEFVQGLKKGNKDYIARFKKVMYTKMVTGKGYFYFGGKVNRHSPQMYKDRGFKVNASNLCNEISLMADDQHSFTCVLSALNLAKYDEWKDTNAIFDATVFLDCIASEFIERGKEIPKLEKAIRFTEKGRALGLGVCGYHTYLMQKGIPFEGFEAYSFNNNFFATLSRESLRASQWLAEKLGEPEWCKGYGVRNTHRTALMPTKSTALIMGGVSEGINPDPAMVFTQASSAGEISRVNPVLLDLMKKKGIYSKAKIKDITDNKGSVQHVDWLTPEEKLVFRTAFEIDQTVVLRKASSRGKHLCQWQSLNLFFSAEEDEEYIAKIHQMAFEDEGIRGLYYVYGKSGVTASKDECIACQ